MRFAGHWLVLLLVGACTESPAPRERTALDPVEPGREVDAAMPPARDAAVPSDALTSAAGERDGGAGTIGDAAFDASESVADAALAAPAELDAATHSLADAASHLDAAPTVCAIAVDDTGLPGVRMRIEGSRCRFRSGEGGSFRYQVELARPIAYRVADGFGSCGFCGGYGADPAALVRATVGSADVRYCATCDEGCCPPDREASHQLAAGTTEGSLEWPGREWNGPSDTSSPLGPAFPPGSYAVKVELRVPGVGTASAQLPIVVLP